MKTQISTVLKTTVLATTLLTQVTAFADRKWNDANNPRNLDSSYSLSFYGLPQKGDVTDSNKGWSSSYFPKTKGFIAERWQDNTWAGVLKYLDYPVPSPYQVPHLSQGNLNLLSPAEKLDIARGRYDFPVLEEIRKVEKPNPIKDWWRGLCNGWTQASVNLPEPHSIVYTNPQTKISVPFTSGDIKGLLAYYYSYRDRSTSLYIGKSCRAGKKILFDIDGSCKDVNAAAFHVAISNEIGIKKNPLAIDRDPTVQVWNQPFVKYESSYVESNSGPSSKATEGTVKELIVTTKVFFANEQYQIDPSEIKAGTTREDYEDDRHSMPTAHPVLGTSEQSYGTKIYKYVLELNANSEIIGGDWLNDSDPHPDLIWKQNFSLPGVGYGKDNRPDDWSVLKDIVLQATSYARP